MARAEHLIIFVDVHLFVSFVDRVSDCLGVVGVAGTETNCPEMPEYQSDCCDNRVPDVCAEQWSIVPQRSFRFTDKMG